MPTTSGDHSSIEERWKALEGWIIRTAKEILGPLKKRNQKDWYDSETQHMVKERVQPDY